MNMKLWSFFSLLLFPTILAAQSTCVVSYAGEEHREILQAVLTRVILDSEEFDHVTFLKAAGNLAEHDLVVKKDPKNSSFVVTPRLRFSDGYPATWENIEKLNGHLTAPILEHLGHLQREGRKPLRDVVDIFIGSLNWKRLEDYKPKNVTLEPASPNRTSLAPGLRWERLVLEQLLLVLGPLLLGLLIGLPLTKHLTKNEWVDSFFVSLTSIFLTIPPLAVFCVFIPSYGLGQKTVWFTLTLYNLLVVIKSAQPKESTGQLFQSLVFLEKIKKLVITDVSLTTLAAFFGAGGFGSLISLGLTLNDLPLLLRGTMAVSFLAMGVKWVFEAWIFLIKNKSHS